MENYKRGKQVEDIIEREKIPIPNLPEDFVWMQVSDGSKMRNLLKYAMKVLDEQKPVVWTGVGPSLGKAVSCAEIVKRKYKAHQITKICYNKIEDHWEPCNPELEALIVRRDIPTIHILISRQPLDANEPGYQAPGKYDSFWNTSRKSGVDKGPSKSSEKTRQANRRAHLLKQFTGQE